MSVRERIWDPEDLYVEEYLAGPPRRHRLAAVVVTIVLAALLVALVLPMLACSRPRSNGATRSMRQRMEQRRAEAAHLQHLAR